MRREEPVRVSECIQWKRTIKWCERDNGSMATDITHIKWQNAWIQKRAWQLLCERFFGQMTRAKKNNKTKRLRCSHSTYEKSKLAKWMCDGGNKGRNYAGNSNGTDKQIYFPSCKCIQFAKIIKWFESLWKRYDIVERQKRTHVGRGWGGILGCLKY